jgi:aconitate hydratase
VYLRELWPAADELQAALTAADDPSLYAARYARVFEGPPAWRELPAPQGPLYAWDPRSTYIQEPPYFLELSLEDPPPPADIVGARALVVLGDSITTDHISPAGAIAPDSPAGHYLLAQRVPPEEFSVYGARRGNHRVMVLGTFANPRLRNALADGREGGWTRHLPSGEVLPVSEAAARYAAEGVPLVVLAGREYGAGSSRDWAAKGVALLGVRAVLAESYERIHRSNLVGMGVLPLEFLPGEGRRALGLTGEETFTITGLAALAPGAPVAVRAQRPDGTVRQFTMRARLDSPREVEYYRHGGVLPYVLRRLVGQPTAGGAGAGTSEPIREPSAAQGERA